jgi:NAD(P)-dependent dehydrogenase (short-subunit alcohol dehydrogenase family)
MQATQKPIAIRCLGANQRVLVTGSGRGIGSAIAHRFAQDGAGIQLVARAVEELTRTRSELALLQRSKRWCWTLVLPARQLVDVVAQAWGGLDILVTNAGAAAQGGFLELEDNAWAAGFGHRMFANLRVIKHACPLLKASSGIP